MSFQVIAPGPTFVHIGRMAFKDLSAEERREYHRAWRKANPDKVKAAAAKYAAAHPEKERERYRKHHAENRDKRNAQSRAWYAANRDKRIAYEAARKERHKELMAAWVRANPEKQEARVRRYRARAMAADGSHTLEERDAKFEMLGDVCFYCGDAAKLTEDHDIPLSRGGGDEIRNILPACKPCNSAKHAKTAAEFIRIGGRRRAG